MVGRTELFLSARALERTFQIGRHVISRAAFRGEVEFRRLPNGDCEYSAASVREFAAAWVARRSRERREGYANRSEAAGAK